MADKNVNAETLVRTSGDSVVVSFQGAKSPSVWRAKLSSLDEAVFKVEAAGKNKYILFFDKAGSGPEQLAEFTTKSAANEALAAISDVLFNLDTQPEAEAVVTTETPKAVENDEAILSLEPHKMTYWRRIYWIAFLVLFLIFAAVIIIGTFNNPQNISGGDLRTTLPDRPNSQTMGGDINDLPAIEEGRPMSADDFFSE